MKQQLYILLILLIALCTLSGCAKVKKVEKVEIVPISVIFVDVYATEMRWPSETPHYAVFAVVNCEVHGGYTPYSQYKTEYPLEKTAKTFAGYPIYNNDDTINVKMTEHRKTDLEGIVILMLASYQTEVVFLGFFTQGTYMLNVNGFEKEFSVK